MSEILAKRLLERSEVDAETGCRRWAGQHYRNGYAQVYWENRSQLGHRLAYELWVGPIPEGLCIDHVAARGCRHRDCINPDHLEPVTWRENLLRGDTIPAAHAAKTTCPQGHAYDRIDSKGARRCRRCVAAASRRVRQRRLTESGA